MRSDATFYDRWRVPFLDSAQHRLRRVTRDHPEGSSHATVLGDAPCVCQIVQTGAMASGALRRNYPVCWDVSAFPENRALQQRNPSAVAGGHTEGEQDLCGCSRGFWHEHEADTGL